MRQSFAATATICILGLLPIACGDDEETTGATEETANAPTKEEFIQQADAICLDVNQQLQPLKQQEFPTKGPQIIEPALDELRALPPPEGEEQQVDELLTSAEDGLAELEQLGGGAPQSAPAPRGDPFGEFTRLAEEFGLTGGCTRNEG